MIDPGAAGLAEQAPGSVRTHLGVIDLGTNAIRLQVSRVYNDGTFRVIHDEREPVRLGEEVFRTGALSAEAVRAAVATLVRYSEVARRCGAERIRPVATSAVREAMNGKAFLKEVERASGLRLEIISGKEEARLIARGVLSSVTSTRGRLALVDVGGGSTELTIVEQGRVRLCTSMRMGSVRLTEQYCHSDPLSAEDERRLRRHIRDLLERAAMRGGLVPCTTVVGSAGTIGALANYIRRRCDGDRFSARMRSSFTLAQLRRASAALRQMDLAARRATPGVEERRSEIIVAGAIILEEVCALLGARCIKTVRRGLRDGVMIDEVERLGWNGVVPTPLPCDPPRRPLRR